jgi:flagellar hook-length control protein FliK
MNTIAAAVTFTADLPAPAATPTPPATPRAAAAETARADRATRAAPAKDIPATQDDPPDRFADALSDQMDAQSPDGHRPAATARRAGTAAKARAGSGDDTPPDGNALPPWGPGAPADPARTPPPGASPALNATLQEAAAAAARAARPAAAPTPANAPAAIPTADPATVTAGVNGVADTAAAALLAGGPPAAAAASVSGTAAPTPADAAAQASGAATPELAKAAATGAEAAARLLTGRAAGAETEVVVAPLPAAAPTGPTTPAPVVPAELVPPAWTAALERRAAPAASGTPAPGAAPALDPAVPTGAVDVPVAPLLKRAVGAILAARGSDGPPSALASAPVPDPGAAAGPAALGGGLAASAAAAPGAPPAAANAPAIGVPVGAPDWDRQLGERVQVLVDQGLTNAQLKLSPAHLGPLEVRISLQADQASVWFGTHSHATREALEAAAPRLKEMLGAQGFAQVGVSVDLQQQGFREARSNARSEPEYSFAAGAAPAAVAAPAPARRLAPDPARLDAFA